MKISQITDPTQQQLEALLEKRILFIDGAMGTMIQQHKLEEEHYRGEKFKDHPSDLKGNNDLLSITQPEIIADIHRQYFESGADIVETNTFNGTRISQEDYGTQDFTYEINFESAKIAKQVANEMKEKYPHRSFYVAGALGPTNKTASMSPDENDPGFRAVSFDDLVESYYEQAKALVEGGRIFFSLRPLLTLSILKPASLPSISFTKNWDAGFH